MAISLYMPDPRSVFYHPAMAFPRRDWIVYHDGLPVVIDLYATRNMLEVRKQRYQLNIRAWEVLDRFMDDLRFTEYVNLAHWYALPSLDGSATDPLMAEDWLIAYGVRGEPIDWVDLTIEDSDEDLEPLDFDIEDTMFDNLEDIQDEIDTFISRLLDEED